jgi:hypothetical protein
MEFFFERHFFARARSNLVAPRSWCLAAPRCAAPAVARRALPTRLRWLRLLWS